MLDLSLIVEMEGRIYSSSCFATRLNLRVSLKPSLRLFQLYSGMAVSRSVSDFCWDERPVQC